MTQTREQLLLAKPVGISQMLVLLAKRVGISQLLQLVELEVRKLLCNYDFPDNGVPIVFGSALLVSQALMANPVVKDVPPSIPSSIVYGCQGLYRTRYNQGWRDRGYSGNERHNEHHCYRCENRLRNGSKNSRGCDS
ncbi:hypothetical protein V6N13_139721 [Hibiscus sabdariffa]